MKLSMNASSKSSTSGTSAAPDQQQYREFLDPHALATVEDLELVARSVVEGFKQGLHRSPFVGFSVEFSAHREYMPGDDLRHINWKAYGRQERLYIKQYDAETNVELHLIVDVSASMLMASQGLSKLRYAVMLAAALGHLSLTQRDSAGITLYSDRIVDHVKPRSNPDQLFEMLHPLTRLQQHASCNSPKILHEVAELVSRRSLVVLIGDFFFEEQEFAECLEHLRHGGNELLLFHVLDPIEQGLSVDGPIKFHDLESGQQVIAQAHELRESYSQAITDWQTELQRICNGFEVDYTPVTTDTKLDRALAEYLATRSELF